MIIKYKVRHKTTGEEIELCGFFLSVDKLKENYGPYTIDTVHGWELVTCSIVVLKENFPSYEDYLINWSKV